MTPGPALGYEVSLPVFTGPFRLLADLIMEQKVDVCDVSLGRITDGFIQEGMRDASFWSLEEATWFLAMCASLVELKVGRLMPRRAPESEEELLGMSSPDLVYARSLELAAFRRVSSTLGELMASAALMMARPAGIATEYAHLYPDPMSDVSPATLGGLAAGLLAPAPPVDLGHVTPIRFTLADALRSLRDQLSVQPEARFRDVVGDCRERIEVVVRFLALLELYREGKVELMQAGPLGEIEIRWRKEA